MSHFVSYNIHISSYLEDSTDSNFQILDVEIWSLVTLVSLAQGCNTDEKVLKAIFFVNCPDSVFNHLDQPGWYFYEIEYKIIHHITSRRCHWGGWGSRPWRRSGWTWLILSTCCKVARRLQGHPCTSQAGPEARRNPCSQTGRGQVDNTPGTIPHQGHHLVESSLQEHQPPQEAWRQESSDPSAHAAFFPLPLYLLGRGDQQQGREWQVGLREPQGVAWQLEGLADQLQDKPLKNEG